MYSINFNITQLIKLSTLFFITLSSTIVEAQDCEEAFVQANVLYNEGKLSQVPEKINSCIELGYESESKQIQARRLVILSYLYADRLDEAEENMLLLLKQYPEYKPVSADPAELKNLYSKFRTRPIMTFGLLGGVTYNQAHIEQTFGVGSEELHSAVEYAPKVNFKVGVSFSYLLNTHLHLNLSPSYENVVFETSEKPLNFSTTTMKEAQSWLHVPLVLRWMITQKTKLKPFIGVGGGLRYLLSASIEGTQSFDNSEIADIEPSPITVKEQRKEILYEAYFQLGFQVKSRMTHWTVMATYSYALDTFNKPNNRYDNSELIFSYGFIDNDIKLDVISLNVSFSYDFYKPKMYRKYRKLD
ncbi:outer membrane beta-barrel protein [Flammeovirga kamogawensis]|uniref:PorT family protein n=1 Tax=Flammeovirga kamogawensis TaxID=373891 RepID=A0ABX8GVQ0_9BACT|nr:outer membrane beta-barrel protein [Flammeovirga kamogawensis]MBB6461585.1 outer membrane protein W [Flammeovirga kamogawensis]QWG07484.1 PorT family protein [Flammeovirga kamogawensis]TRX69297.1 outer membrane beta-barrel protein [Flammeovirga kamogawensis]